MERSIFFVLLLVMLSTTIRSQNETQNFSNVTISGNLSVGTEEKIAPLTVEGDLSLGLNNEEKSSGDGRKLFFRGVYENGHSISLYRYNKSLNQTDLRVHIGNSFVRSDSFTVGNIIWDDPRKEWRSWLTVLNNGRVGINTSTPQYTLDVKGTLRATAIKVESIDKFADFVFHRDYKLRSLSEVEQFVQKNGHLPEIPSAMEVKENGMDLVEMQIKLLQKVEELTLYVIEQQKTIEILQQRLGE